MAVIPDRSILGVLYRRLWPETQTGKFTMNEISQGPAEFIS